MKDKGKIRKRNERCMKKVDLRSYPFRGILKEMSKELGKSVPDIHKALFRRKSPNPVYAEMFERKLEERQEKVRKFQRSLKNAS